mgnify:CR=1 FL=1
MEKDHRQYVSLQVIAERWDIRLSWLYERSRRDELPGMLRLGRNLRVDVDVFEKAVKEGQLA